MAQFPELKDKIVIVTGGANGIGAATVRSFHEQGAQVFFCDQDVTRGEQLVAELGPTVSFRPVNLSSEGEIVSWIQQIKASGKSIRALVNNAAWDPRIPFLETTSQQWDELFAVNVRAYFLAARECAPVMLPGASIVNLGSIVFYNS
ncbi:MAG TPA: SDR family oxidoreductase, partial [Methylomirabilota bacterium]|nr:SDR family oxidoreductase [Methylomirabilota bacterium]